MHYEGAHGLLLRKRIPRRTARRASAAGATAQDSNLLAREGLPKELVRSLPWKRASGENGGRRGRPEGLGGIRTRDNMPEGIGSTTELRSTVVPHCPGQGDAGGGNATRESGPGGQPDEPANGSTPVCLGARGAGFEPATFGVSRYSGVLLPPAKRVLGENERRGTLTYALPVELSLQRAEKAGLEPATLCSEGTRCLTAPNTEVLEKNDGAGNRPRGQTNALPTELPRRGWRGWGSNPRLLVPMNPDASLSPARSKRAKNAGENDGRRMPLRAGSPTDGEDGAVWQSQHREVPPGLTAPDAQSVRRLYIQKQSKET